MMKRIIEKKFTAMLTLLITQAVSIVGTRMTAIALGIWLYQRTGQATDILLIPFFNEIPSLLFGPILGTAVDRFDRRWVLIGSDLGQALGTLVLYASISSGGFALWHLYTVVFAQGVFSAMQEPAADASLTLVTTRENRVRVNALKEMMFPAAGMIAPALAGTFYVLYGIEGVIVADLVSFAGSALLLSVVRLPSVSARGLEEIPDYGFLKELRAGFAFLASRRELLWLALYCGAVNFLLNGPLELVIPYILELTNSPGKLSVFMVLMGVATTLSALTVSVVSLPRTRIYAAFAGMLATGVFMMLFGRARHVLSLGVSLFLLMFPLPVLNIVLKTMIQDKTPANLQGRVFSAVNQIAFGLAPLSFLLVGPLTDQWVGPALLGGKWGLLGRMFGTQPGSKMGLVIFSGGLLIVVLTMAGLVSPALRGMERRLKDYN